jgi:hypothetical protein
VLPFIFLVEPESFARFVSTAREFWMAADLKSLRAGGGDEGMKKELRSPREHEFSHANLFELRT